MDDLQTLKSGDPGDMLQRIAELPHQLQEAWQHIQAFEPPPSLREVRAVVVTGMGGSAIGGSLVAALAEPECPVPIVVNRDYHLPAFVDEHTLVVASSYSGNTEETLSATQEALEFGAQIVAITTGGHLAELARERGFPLITFDYRAQPRAAIGHSFALLLGVLVRIGLLADKTDELAEATDVLLRLQRLIGPETPTERNPAKELAHQLVGRVPTIYGAGMLAPVARRWKGQFNENAKTWAAFDEMPELNHNAVVGYQFPEHLRDTAFVIMLRCPLDHERVQARFEITAELLEQAGIEHTVVYAWGEGAVAQMWSVLHYGDYVSYYLAALNGIDPTPVERIDYLKRRLTQV